MKDLWISVNLSVADNADPEAVADEIFEVLVNYDGYSEAVVSVDGTDWSVAEFRKR